MEEEKVNQNEVKDEEVKETNEDATNNQEENVETEDIKKYTENDVDTINNENEKLKNELEESKNKYQRLLAEFENYRKRLEKEKGAMFKIGATSILTNILPVVDNFERALQNIPEDLKDNKYTEGIDNIYKQMMKIFEDLKVSPIKAKGEKFDANFHNAVMTDEESDAESDVITEELQKGWMYDGDVIRHSMVKVKK